MDAGHYRRIERRRGITGAAETMRAAVRAAASLQQQSDVDTCTISSASNRPGNDGFYSSTSLISSTFGSRYLIRKYRTDEVRVHGCPVPNWGFRYGTDGLSTTLDGTSVDIHPAQ